MAEPLFRGSGPRWRRCSRTTARSTPRPRLRRQPGRPGIRAVAVAGSTGEAARTAGERIALLTETRKAVPAGVPVIAGTGGPSARQAAALTRDAREAGADAVLALCPPRNNDPRPYYEAVAEAAGDLFVLAYHFPQTAPPGIPVGRCPTSRSRA